MNIETVLPPDLAGQASWLLVGVVVASGEDHLRTLDLVQDLESEIMKVPTHCLSHLVKFLFIDLLCDEGGGWVEAGPGPEVRVAGEPGHQVSSPAGPHTPEHLRPLGPGVREDLVADLRLERAVPVGLGDQPVREVWGGDSLA